MLKFFLFVIILSIASFASIYGQSAEVVYLSGKGFDHTVEWDFKCSSGNNSGYWSKISVPSQWELEGFGEYTYGRWYKQKGKTPSKETGHYKTTFHAPAEWKNKNITIVFEGVMTDTKVLINGKQAGEIHQGGFYRFTYDISKLVKTNSDNLLEVLVAKHSENHSVNTAERMADWWLFGGIYRPVYLEVKSNNHIKQIKTNPKDDGSLYAEINHSLLKKEAILKCSLKDVNGNTYPSYTFDVEKKTSTTEINTKWDNIKPWNPEDPNLYFLTIELIQNNTTLHSITEKIGFRTIEVKPQDGIYCNGTKIILKGINRHTFWPDGGRCTNKEISLLDAQLIKEMNMNAVRCHYPPDEHFLDACDSLGLFFIDELAGWQNAYDNNIGKKLVTEMIERDVNHPCVIIWSNGNEGGWNTNTDIYFETLDPQKRDVIHPWADFDNIDTHHYPQYQTGVHRFNNGEKIFMPTEFLHGLYDEGHGAGLDDFWAKFTSHPMFAGGFLWAFNDGAVRRSDLPDTLDSEGSLAPDGVVGPYREKEGSFYTIKEIWAPIQFKPILITPEFKGEFYITNKYLYTNLNKCKMSYKVCKVPGPWEQTGSTETIAEGNISIPDILPNETRKLKMVVPENFADGDLLLITATDHFGKEIYTWSWPIKLAKQFYESKLSQKDFLSKSEIRETEKTVSLKAKSSIITFDKISGEIEKITTEKGLFPLSGGPVPVGMKAKPDNSVSRMEDSIAVFTVWYKGGIDSIRWEMHPDGMLKMAMIALNKATNDGGFDGGYVEAEIDHWGITFDFDESEAVDFNWFGKGPYRVWKNRQKGAIYNLWNKDYNNTITGESFNSLEYPEYKGYHANTYWGKIKTKSNIPFQFASENNNLYFRLFTPQEAVHALKPSLPVFPEGDISFLYEINPIRAFKETSQMGPQSDASSIRIKKGDEGISMVLWFKLTEKE